jgi:fibronectin type 3 domain-containing protein
MVLGQAGLAEAYNATLTWTEPSGSTIASYKVYVGSASGLSDVLIQSLGLPTPNSGGVYSATVTVADGTTVYASVTAIDNTGSESSRSNTIVIQTGTQTLGAPGQPILMPWADL